MAHTDREYTADDVKHVMGLRLKALRKEMGLTQRQVSARLEIGRSTVSGIESGKTFGHILKLNQLCKLYDAPIDFLLTGQGLNRTLNTKLGTLAQRKLPSF